LLGQLVAHSLSPALHNRVFGELGMNAAYAAWEVETADLPGVMTELRAADVLGANVTAPHKQAVMPLLDEVGHEARLLGAVNTIVNGTGRLVGHNTDARGLAHWMLGASIAVEGKSALVLGAGGAARAAVWALGSLGASRVHVVNRRAERAAKLVAELGAAASSLTCGPLDEAARPTKTPWAVVINATSLGHHGQAPDVHPSCYSPQSVAIELAYNPPETPFMQAARDAGARTENGLGMLLHQAALAFECWTGQSAPLAVYDRAFREVLEERLAR
jgi:shikimate dehydrogenase